MPADSLLGRVISVDFGVLNVRIDAEVRGVHAQGKPRLRKFDSNNRNKMHLPQLVMAVTGLPEPARSDKGQAVTFPLENKAFVIDEMCFDVLDDDGLSIVLVPLHVSVLHSNFRVDLQDRLQAIRKDWNDLQNIRSHYGALADAIEQHRSDVRKGLNSSRLRESADKVIGQKATLFGNTNAGSATTLIETSAKPEVEAEKVVGKEGRLLVRLHRYKERDRKFARMVRKYYKDLSGGKLTCHACGCVPTEVYGPLGDGCMEAHHKIPIEQLQPDSIMRVSDMAMLCASCHRLVHSQKPCLTVEGVSGLVSEYGGRGTE